MQTIAWGLVYSRALSRASLFKGSEAPEGCLPVPSVSYKFDRTCSGRPYSFCGGACRGDSRIAPTKSVACDGDVVCYEVQKLGKAIFALPNFCFVGFALGYLVKYAFALSE